MTRMEKFCLITGCILIAISIVLLIRMNTMQKELDSLRQTESALSEELERYQQQ